MSITDIFVFVEKNLTLICALVATGKWLYETQKQRKWETNKYLVERLKEFQEKSSTKLIHEILDYSDGISIEVNQTKESICDRDIIDALQTHDIKQNFTLKEASIRDNFDNYFDNLTELILLSKCGLVDSKNLKFLLKYYIDIINGNSNRKSKKYVDQLKKYLSFYNYDSVLKFIK